MESYLIASINLSIKLELLHHWRVIVLGFNDQMLMKVSISLETWMQCGPSHVNVDAMWVHHISTF